MVILESIRIIHCLSQYLGVAPYRMKKIKGKYYFCESRFFQIYNRLLIFLLSVLCVISGVDFFLGISRKSLWSVLNISVDALSAILNLLATPAIFLIYRKKIYKNLNRCEEMYSLLSSIKEKKVHDRCLKYTNNAALLGYVLIMFWSVALHVIPDFLEFLYKFMGEIYIIFAIPVYLMFNLTILQFFTHVNIVRFMYFNINEILISHRNKKLEWRTLKLLLIVDDFLKDFLNDLSVTFLPFLIFHVFQSFVSIVDSAYSFIMNNHDINEQFFKNLTFVLGYYTYIISSTTTISMSAKEGVISKKNINK